MLKIGALGECVTYLTTQMSSMVSTISSNALMLIPVGFFVIGGAIGLVKRVLG